MSYVDDSGPAFPSEQGASPEWDEPYAPGMSLRDWFAGQALAGLLASAAHGYSTVGEVASDAYWHADAMLYAATVDPDA